MVTRRVIFWSFAALALIAELILQFPTLQYITIHGRQVGGSGFAYAALGSAISILLLWSAVYVRLEPLLVRLTLLFISIPLCWQSAVEIWHLITFLARPQP
jgi:hypothetical protein